MVQSPTTIIQSCTDDESVKKTRNQDWQVRVHFWQEIFLDLKVLRCNMFVVQCKTCTVSYAKYVIRSTSTEGDSRCPGLPSPKLPAPLTLIELIVVLMILIALAGILVPMLPSMLTRSHTATCSTNIGEVVKAVNQFNALYGSYPNNWDALTDGTTNVIDYFANGSMRFRPVAGGPGTNPGNGEITAIKLTGPEASALTGVGITTVMPMVKTAPNPRNGFDPTFNNYTTYTNASLTPPTPLAIASGVTLAGLDPTNSANTAAIARCQSLNLPLTGRYAVLGLGPLTSMVGKTINSAPVHFGDQPVLNPEYGYERLVVLFKISDSAASAFTQAQMVGAGPVHDTGLGKIDDELQNFYQIQAGGS